MGHGVRDEFDGTCIHFVTTGYLVRLVAHHPGKQIRYVILCDVIPCHESCHIMLKSMSHMVSYYFAPDKYIHPSSHPSAQHF